MDKVCILTTVHPPFDTRIFYKQAKTLVEGGYEVCLIAQHKRTERVGDVNICALPSPANRLQRMVGLGWKAFRLACRQKADVYHFHDPELLVVGLLLKLLTPAKVIYDVHEDYPSLVRARTRLPALLSKVASLIIDCTERLCARCFDQVITVTDKIRARFPADRTILIRNYPRLDWITPSRKFESADDTCTLVYVGGLAAARGVLEMIEALEHVHAEIPFQLKLAGRFVSSAFEGQVRSLDGFRFVDYLGVLPYAEVARLLVSADIGLLLYRPTPNLMNAWPNKLFEYMAAGLPVVASDFPVWTEIIGPAQCGLTVDPRNPHEIANAISRLIDDARGRQLMGENGYRAHRTSYNWESEGKRLLKTYERLLATSE